MTVDIAGGIPIPSEWLKPCSICGETTEAMYTIHGLGFMDWYCEDHRRVVDPLPPAFKAARGSIKYPRP